MSIADLNQEIKEIMNINDDISQKVKDVEEYLTQEKKLMRKYNLAIILFFILSIIYFPFIVVLLILFIAIIKQARKSKKDLMQITNNIKVPKYISDLNNELESNNNKIKKIRVLIEKKLNEITLKTYVAGTSFRQKEIKKLISYLKQSYIIEENSLYDMTKREMIDLYFVDEMIWQFDLTKIPLVLVPEPDNEHDEDAVAVYYEDNDFEIKIGYVPKKDLNKIMTMDIDEVYGQLKGGKYKILEQDIDDYDFDKETFNLVRGEYNYSLDLFIQQKEH